MNAAEAIKAIGGQTILAKLYNYRVGTVGAWATRNRIPYRVLITDKALARKLKEVGYDATKG